MRRAIRCVAVATLALAGISLPPAQAAPSGAAFAGDMQIACFGCGTSPASFSGTAAGIVDGREVAGPVGAEFSVDAPPVPDDPCTIKHAPIEGWVAFLTPTEDVVLGTFVGSLTVTTGVERSPAAGTATARVTVLFESGATALMEFGGEIRQPAGPPCGLSVYALIQGAIGSPGATAGCLVGTCEGPYNALAFEGTWVEECFGCGVSPATMNLTVTAGGPGGIVVGGQASSSFTAGEPADVTCVLTGAASGLITGAVDFWFNFTRVGAFAVITTSGDVHGPGTATFTLTSPLGNPCGGPAEAYVTAQLVGI
jgi:hypothetical protein